MHTVNTVLDRDVANKCAGGSTTKAVVSPMRTDCTYRVDKVRPLPFHSVQRTMAIETIHRSEMPVPPHDSHLNREQTTLTRDDKCQGSTHTPYMIARWEHKAVSAEMATHWCPDTHMCFVQITCERLRTYVHAHLSQSGKVHYQNTPPSRQQ